MSFFDLLIVAHLIGDWLMQTEYEAMRKAKDPFFNWGLWKHCLVYTLWFVPVFLWVGVSCLWLLPLLASHLFLDRRWPIVWWLRHVKRTSRESIEKNFWLVVAVDQVAHAMVLVLLVFVSGKGP